MRGGRPQGRQDPTQEGLQTHPAELRARTSHQDGIKRHQWSACASRLSGYSFCSTPPRPRNVPVTHLRAGSRKTVYQCFPFKAPVTAAGTEVGW